MNFFNEIQVSPFFCLRMRKEGKFRVQKKVHMVQMVSWKKEQRNVSSKRKSKHIYLC